MEERPESREIRDTLQQEAKLFEPEASAAEYKLPARYKDYRVVDVFGGIAGNIQVAYKET